ncbi:DUF4416 family protein [Candidatus Woesearchaeota archaeon]|nr:DUF4416 family protein [Candidatus Woesearchaeota archaeon]
MNKLLIAVMYKDSPQKALDILKKEYGNVLTQTKEYDFTFTDYYEKEFGKNLKKTIFIFEKKIEKKDLVEIRERTGEIEQQLSLDGKRTVNIDPGYISKKELVLATKKSQSYKKELGKGVFAHKVLGFNGEVKTFHHTFKDYKLLSTFFLSWYPS